MKSNEVFKIIEDHPTYMVSNLGRVLNTKRNRFLAGTVRDDNYHHVTLNQKKYYVHQLVASSFLIKPSSLHEVNHIDEDRSNNQLGNLEWMLHGDNVEYSKAKSYKFCNPLGEVVEVFNLTKFCRDNSMHNGHLFSVANGTKKSYRGWTLCH